MSLEGVRLFTSSNDGKTYLLQKFKTGASEYKLYFSRLDDPNGGISIPLQTKEIIDETPSRYKSIVKDTDAGKVSKVFEQGKWTTKLTGYDGSARLLSENSFGYNWWNNFEGGVADKPLTEIKAFCEKFGNIGKVIYKRYLEAMLKLVK